MPKIRLDLSIRLDDRNMTLLFLSLPIDGYAVPSQINAFNNYINKFHINLQGIASVMSI